MRMETQCQCSLDTTMKKKLKTKPEDLHRRLIKKAMIFLPFLLMHHESGHQLYAELKKCSFLRHNFKIYVCYSIPISIKMKTALLYL